MKSKKNGIFKTGINPLTFEAGRNILVLAVRPHNEDAWIVARIENAGELIDLLRAGGDYLFEGRVDIMLESSFEKCKNLEGIKMKNTIRSERDIEINDRDENKCENNCRHLSRRGWGTDSRPYCELFYCFLSMNTSGYFGEEKIRDSACLNADREDK